MKSVYREVDNTVRKIDFVPDPEAWEGVTVRDYADHNYLKYSKCYICGGKLKLHEPPRLLSVAGIGIRFCCSRCWTAWVKAEETA